MQRKRLGAVVATRALPLLWHGRMSWLRMSLSIVYGWQTYRLVTWWRIETPNIPSDEGWVLKLFPQAVQSALLSHPVPVSIAVVVLAGLSFVGLASRPALIGLALIGLFANALRASQGAFDHEASLTTQVLIVLAIAPGTNAISAGRLLAWWRNGRESLWTCVTTPYRQWGVKLILALLAVTYITSGVSKLRFGGLSWLDGETLGFYMRGLTSGNTAYVVGSGAATWRDDFGLEMYTYGNYAYGTHSAEIVSTFVDWVANNSTLLAALSIGTVLLELCGALLFVPRLRSVLLVCFIGLHTGIDLFMGLGFTQYRLICFFLIEWELVDKFVQRRSRRRTDQPMNAQAPHTSSSGVVAYRGSSRSHVKGVQSG